MTLNGLTSTCLTEVCSWDVIMSNPSLSLELGGLPAEPSRLDSSVPVVFPSESHCFRNSSKDSFSIYGSISTLDTMLKRLKTPTCQPASKPAHNHFIFSFNYY